METKTVSDKQWTKSVATQWGLFLPPARPSFSELCVIEKYLIQTLKRNPNAQIAILGSTPEYRDLCQSYRANYKCIDYNAQNFSELGAYMLHKDEPTHLIESDWRKMEFANKFDLFIGDLVTTVTPINDHNAVLQNIKNKCNPRAKIILKIPLRRTNLQMTHKEIFQKYRASLSHLNPFGAVWHEVLMADYNLSEDTMDCQTSLMALTKSYRDGIINEYEWDEFKKRWDALGDFKMNIPLRKEYLKKISNNFKIENITSGNDWYKDWAPIIIAHILIIREPNNLLSTSFSLSGNTLKRGLRILRRSSFSLR